jgi:restriction system protein
MLGKRSSKASEMHNGKFIGVGFSIDEDLSENDFNDIHDFKAKYVDLYLEKNPKKTKLAAAQACGILWRILRDINIGDVVLCPDGKGNYFVGEIVSDYDFKRDQPYPHRRDVRWYQTTISRSEMSQSLKNSSGSISTMCSVTKHSDELESLLAGTRPQMITVSDETVDDASEFALEEQLEAFLVKNWKSLELGKNFDIYEEDGELIGQQYDTNDVGRIDILAISKDKKTILVIELKKGKAVDTVVGQCLRYMGFVKSEVAEEGQTVSGMIIASEDSKKIKYALSQTSNIDFYTYKLDFQLSKQN